MHISEVRDLLHHTFTDDYYQVVLCRWMSATLHGGILPLRVLHAIRT